jgi:hypothetical protein
VPITAIPSGNLLPFQTRQQIGIQPNGYHAHVNGLESRAFTLADTENLNSQKKHGRLRSCKSSPFAKKGVRNFLCINIIGASLQ